MQEISPFRNCLVEKVDYQTLLISPVGGSDMNPVIENFLLNSIPLIREELKARGLKKALIVRGEGKTPFPVLLGGKSTAPTLALTAEQVISTIARNHGRDLAKQQELIAEQEARGLIVVITGMETDLCKHTNDLLTPERGIRIAPLWTGYNYRKSWCTAGDGVPSAEYDRLIEILHRDRWIDGYNYRLIRPDDGAIVEYQTDYIFIPNWHGEPVRVGFSNPKDFRVVEAGRGDRVIK